MTTAEAPARRAVPTPRDVAEKALPRRAADLLTPGSLLRGERFRPLYEQGLRGSAMTPHTRLVAWTLLSYASARTGDLPADRQPFLAGLVAATGLNPGQVVVQLRVLEQRGWVQRDPASPHAYEQAVLRPVIPGYVLAQLRAS
ncbi:hypothetical protein ACGF7W_19685 [Streptomyces sp. NPDC048219]|uniref:hypothetical protein n=1 Tax=Streptomyces sp. NPDC048219 TaxID=3365517 RepID=UPI003710B8D0